MPLFLRLALVALLCTAVGPVAADSPLRTLATGDAGRGYEAVGRVDVGETGFCTGTLIAPDLVLTAAHCLYDPDSGRPIPAAALRFLAGLRNGRAEAYRGVRRAVVHPDYTYGEPDRLDRVAYDAALLQLDQPIRNPQIRPFAAAQMPEVGDEVSVVSYAKGREAAPALEDSCEVLAGVRRVVMFSCNVDFGSSGAPIFRMVEGERRIVSVVSAKADSENRPVALGIEVDAVLATLRDSLAGGSPRARLPQIGGSAAEGSGAVGKFVRP